jgi:hypothetical protein
MTTTETKTETTSPHLGPARELLSNLDGITRSPGADPQVQATAAVAHAVLVLAEQVAVVRVLMAGEAARNAQPNGSSN